jgi:hypothetical protein
MGKENVLILYDHKNRNKAEELKNYLSRKRWLGRYKPVVLNKTDNVSIQDYLSEDGASAIVIDKYCSSHREFKILQDYGSVPKARYPFFSISLTTMEENDMADIENSLREIRRRNRKFIVRL